MTLSEMKKEWHDKCHNEEGNFCCPRCGDEFDEDSPEAEFITENGFCDLCYKAQMEDLQMERLEGRIPDFEFANPGGYSALRAETDDNPRIYSCPNCRRENQLTLKDKQKGYQCDFCADQAERGF